MPQTGVIQKGTFLQGVIFGIFLIRSECFTLTMGKLIGIVFPFLKEKPDASQFRWKSNIYIL